MLIVCGHFCIFHENPRQIIQSCSAVAQCSMLTPRAQLRDQTFGPSVLALQRDALTQLHFQVTKDTFQYFQRIIIIINIVIVTFFQ